MEPVKYKLGLSLSGGGYRAAAFHLGTLRALKTLGVLQKVDVISTISGGSITGAYYCLNKDDFDGFDKQLYEKLRHADVVNQLVGSWIFVRALLFVLLFAGTGIYLLFTPYAWASLLVLALFVVLLLKFQFRIFPASKGIEEIYDKFLYQKKTLCDLPPSPCLVIGSTNLQTARPFIFSFDRMEDSKYKKLATPILFNHHSFPIARAVMASSCVPFAFTPVEIDRKYFVVPGDADIVHPRLVDGGVYDNQGIHKIVQKGHYSCPVVIVSDAGGGSKGESFFRNTISLLITTVDVFMDRIKKAQMIDDVYNNAAGPGREIAYLSLGWEADNLIPGFIKAMSEKQVIPAVLQAHHLAPDWIAAPLAYATQIKSHLEQRTGYAAVAKPTPEEKTIARNVTTNLKGLSKEKIEALIKQAEALTTIQVKLYCPSIFN